MQRQLSVPYVIHCTPEDWQEISQVINRKIGSIISPELAAHLKKVSNKIERLNKKPRDIKLMHAIRQDIEEMLAHPQLQSQTDCKTRLYKLLADLRAKTEEFRRLNVGAFATLPADMIQLITNKLTGHDIANMRLAASYFGHHQRLKNLIQAAQRQCRVFVQEENIYVLFNDGRLFFLDKTRTKLEQVNIPAGDAVATVAVGESHALALTENGLCYGWGTRKYLGIPTTRTDKEQVISHARPGLVTLNNGKKIIKIAAVSNQTFIADEMGNWFACGRNDCGQLGLGDYNSHSNFDSLDLIYAGKKITAVFPSRNITYAIDQMGGVYYSGRNSQNSGISSFVQMICDSKIVKIAAGKYHALYLDDKNKIYVRSINNNRYGQLGQIPIHGPTQAVFNVASPLSPSTVDIVAGSFRSFFISETQCLATGKNYFGELGAAETMPCHSGEQGLVILPDNERVVKVAPGNRFTLFQSATGKHYINGQQGEMPKQIDPAKSRAEFYKPKSSP